MAGTDTGDGSERRIAELEDFAAMAAHELIEPLVMVEAYVTMVCARLGEEAHAEAMEDLRRVMRVSARTRRVVEALLHAMRQTPGRASHEPVALAEVVAEAAETLSAELTERGIRLDVVDLPTVRGDRRLLIVLFQNLLSNAIKYGAAREHRIRVDGQRDGDAWTIAVRSRGDAIPVDQRERIFDPFERGDGSAQTRGAGLGLAICRMLAERHGGRIGLLSSGGDHAFVVVLPD